jgi:hypothetical protein
MGRDFPDATANDRGRYIAASLFGPLMVSLSNHKRPLTLRQAQDERPEAV